MFNTRDDNLLVEKLNYTFLTKISNYKRLKNKILHCDQRFFKNRE